MTEEEIVEALQTMQSDASFVTKSAYRANAELWPGNRISFVDSHMAYLKTHPALSPEHYLSNLRLMLRRQSSDLQR